MTNNIDSLNDSQDNVQNILDHIIVTKSGKNLLNINGLTEGWLFLSSGNFTASEDANQWVTDFIPVDGSKVSNLVYSVLYEGAQTATNVISSCQYDGSKSFVIGSGNTKVISIDNTTKYIRVCIQTADKTRSPQLEIGTEPTEYEEYIGESKVQLINQDQVDKNTEDIASLYSLIDNDDTIKGSIILVFDDITNDYENRFNLVYNQFGFSANIALNDGITDEILQNKERMSKYHKMFSCGWDWGQYLGDDYPGNSASSEELATSIKSMQDRFRFRVWYKDLYSPDEPRPRMIYGAEGTYDCFCANDERIPASSFGVIIDDEEFIPMQCTGIKDKNGKLIYEGDIVKIIDKSSRKEPFIGVVEYTKIASFEANCNGLYMHLHESKTYENISMVEKIFCTSLREIEVIGNIHENPELLEQKDVN